MNPHILADRSLSCRLERAEGLTNANFVEARARVMPDSRAKWISIAGALAMFDGVNSPCTQTFCLGLFQLPTEQELDEIEKFFKARGAPIVHEVSPHADKALLPMLAGRGYRPFEQSNVLYLPLAAENVTFTRSNPEVRVRLSDESERDRWAQTSAEGWGEYVEVAGMILELGRIVATAESNKTFLAELDGAPVATGALSIHEGVALFAGASTIPTARRRGAQAALMAARFRHAIAAGCDLAMMVAEPGSSSQRNAERQGFRIAYTRTKWTLHN
jgi:GNAT superfamily N-acetyltransferase